MCVYSVYIFMVMITFLLIDNGEAIQCYECNSHNDTLCADGVPPPEMERNCTKDNSENTTYVLCRKIVQTIDFEPYGLPKDSRVVRSCGWDDSKYEDSCYRNSRPGYYQEVCSCTSDLCNSGDVPSSVLSTLASTLGLVLGLPLTSTQ